MSVMNNRPVIVGIGEILWDMLPSGRQLGGAVTNFAYHAQSLGGEGIVASCIGEDALGREIVSRLDGLGMSTRFLAVDPAHPTGTVDVTLDAKGSPTFIIREDTAWDFIPESNALYELAGRADVVCFGSLAQRSPVSRATIQRFIAATRPDCLRIFDINLRQAYYSAEVIRESLALANVLKLNDAELPVLRDMLDLPADELDAMRQIVRQFNLRVIALTRGAAGSRLYTPTEIDEHPGHPTTVVDSVGAGDSFTAALAMGLRNGDPLAAINDRANRLAAYVCSCAGATPPPPA